MPEESWGKVEQLTYLYLALCYGADQDFAKEEKSVLVQKVMGLDSMLSKKAAVALINSVAKSYIEDRRSGSNAPVRLTIQRLGQRLSSEELSQALGDLFSLAQADGMIVDGEWDLIDECKRSWGVLGS